MSPSLILPRLFAIAFLSACPLLAQRPGGSVINARVGAQGQRVARSEGNGILDSGLPSWWKLSLEIRGRVDSYDGIAGVAGYADGYYMHRLRIDSRITVGSWLRVFTQFQDSRAAAYDRRPVPSGIHNPGEFRQAYVDVLFGEQRPWSIRLGRQAISYGDVRLIATTNWSNVGPGYDGVKLSYSRDGARLDWFAVEVVQPRTGFDWPCPDRRLAGFYGSFTVGRHRRVLEPYLIWKGNRRARSESLRTGGLDVYTAGLRSTGRLAGSFDYNVELAVQRGWIAGDPLAAWLGHFELGYKQRIGPGDLRLWAEQNYASGDRDPHDGRRQTFEQYYPAIGPRAAEFASRNLHEPLVGMQWQVSPKWRLRGTMRGFWLASRLDALYLLSGAVYARGPQSASRRAGEELGIWVIHDLRKHLQLWGGYGRLFPGPLLKDAGKGAPTNYLFLVWTYTFD